MLIRWFHFLLAAGLAGFAGCAKNDAPPGAPDGGPGVASKQVVEVTPVARRDMIDTLTVVGSLAANESAGIRPEIVGLVQAILFEEGQTVVKGAVLVKLEDGELRAQYAQVEARFKLAELNVARSESLSKTNTIPQSEADRARSEFSVAKAELALLRTRLNKTEVKAPFDGIVGGRVVSPGDYVTTLSVITTIDDLTRLKVGFQVPERFLGKIAQGTPFVLRSGALEAGVEIHGDVYFVSSVIDRNTRSSEVKGLLAKPPALLKPGMFGSIEIVLSDRKGVLTVPEGAILTTTSGSQVIVARGAEAAKTADFVPVELGMRAKGLVEVTATRGTLAEGELVVAAGVGALALYPGGGLELRPLRAEFRVGN